MGTYVSKFEVRVAETPTIALGDAGAEFGVDDSKRHETSRCPIV